MIGDYLETYTFDYLMSRALSRVPDNIDKSQGSVIYDALAPAIQEMALMYYEIRDCRRSISPTFAIGEDLTELASQNGIFRKPAVSAQRKGIFNVDVEIGSRFRIEDVEDVTYKVVSKIEDKTYVLECEQPGEVGNIYSGELMPISYINGLESAMLTDIIRYGQEEESDDSLRSRYRQKISNPPQDGNIAQYKQWAEEFEGIGVSKIFPLWNGGNSVKIAITNNVYRPASEELVAAFQEYIDPESRGLGEGKAPIGSKVTVVSGEEKSINISGEVILTDGYALPEGAMEAVEAYLRSITFNKNSVSYVRVLNALLNCPSIADVTSLTINGASVDIPLEDIEIPVLDTFELTRVV